jgi:tRNA-dihydrouridine synthase
MCLAPMEDVTDAPFRRLIAKYGRPDVTWTEFTSADGLALAPEKGKRALMKKLEYTEGERPIVAQLFSAVPERMEIAARLCEELGFDGIDINMGCPDKTVEKQKCGSGMIRHPDLAVEVIRAAMRGAPNTPVSVKTRIGYNENEIATWIPRLLSENIAALTIHCRTRKELSLVPARHAHMLEVKALRDEYFARTGHYTPIIVNGDILNIVQGKEICEKYGADGAMLGRAIFGNPWLFSGRTTPPSQLERLSALREHVVLFRGHLLEYASFAVMKRHFKAYITGWDGAGDLRSRLMLAVTPEEVLEILDGEIGRMH